MLKTSVGPEPMIKRSWKRLPEKTVSSSPTTATMIGYAYERVVSGLPMPGLLVIDQRLPLGEVISEIVFLAECCDEGEWEGQACYLPLS